MGLDSKKDVHLDGSPVGSVSRLEVLEGASGRRVRSELREPGSSPRVCYLVLSDMARKHEATHWQICDGRRRFRQRGMLAPCEASQSIRRSWKARWRSVTFRRSSLRSRSAMSCCGRTQP